MLASLEETLHILMKATLRQEVLEEATTAINLKKFDIAKSGNQLEVNPVKLGTALKQSLF